MRASLVCAPRPDPERVDEQPGFDPGYYAHMDAQGRRTEGGHPAGQRTG